LDPSRFVAEDVTMEFDPTTMKETCLQLAEEIGPYGVAELL
jgi:hypothetical protein